MMALGGSAPIPCAGWGLGLGLPSPTSDECKAAWASVSAARKMGLPEGSVNILWESAAPVREAKTRLGIDDPVNTRASDAFIISMIGHPLLMNLDDDSMRVLEVIKNSVLLIRKGKSEVPVAASDFVVIKTGENAIARFFFARPKSIPAGTKEWIFRFKMGGTEVEASFDLKEMEYSGALAL